MNEGERQRRLLATLASPADDAAAVALSLRETGARAARGLAAYRANGDAIADRSLGAAFGTVRAMVGDELFTRLAHEFRQAGPPIRGDLGEWGGDFPDWLAAHTGLCAWPWLADCARLDLALHRSERAADDVLDTTSLHLLESEDPAVLRLLLMPGTALLDAAWPIATIHQAHQLAGAAAEPAFERVRVAIAGGQGEQVLVARRGWRSVVHRLEPACHRWMVGVSAGACLSDALALAGDDFDVATWLATAIGEGWLKGVRHAGSAVDQRSFDARGARCAEVMHVAPASGSHWR